MIDKRQVARPHGHVTPNADGYLARCGGPKICKVCKEELAALKQPSAGVDDRAAWTSSKPSEEGAYWLRGNGLDEPALVQVKHERGEFWCNLHMRNSEPDFGYGYTVAQLSESFEWIGPLQVRAQLAAPAGVLEGWRLVPINTTPAMRLIGARDCSALIQPDQADEVWRAMLGAVVVPAEYAFAVAPSPAPASADHSEDERHMCCR